MGSAIKRPWPGAAGHLPVKRPSRPLVVEQEPLVRYADYTGMWIVASVDFDAWEYFGGQQARSGRQDRAYGTGTRSFSSSSQFRTIVKRATPPGAPVSSITKESSLGDAS